MSGSKARTAAQEVLLGASDLEREGKSEFSEWDLTIATWRRDSNKFGCRGYEKIYPDHKRVMKEIMNTGSSNPIRRGWLERSRPNYYRLTDVGRSEVATLQADGGPSGRTRVAPEAIYDAVAPLYRSPIFRRHVKDKSEPHIWLGAASFLRLAKTDRQHFEDRLTATRAAIINAKRWLDAHGVDRIQRGSVGGSEAIHRQSLESLMAFLDTLEERFANQIAAIRKA